MWIEIELIPARKYRYILCVQFVFTLNIPNLPKELVRYAFLLKKKKKNGKMYCYVNNIYIRVSRKFAKNFQKSVKNNCQKLRACPKQ